MCNRKHRTRNLLLWLVCGQAHQYDMLRSFMSELSDKLDRINAQLVKAGGEISQQITELKEALENAQVEDPGVAAAVANLEVVAQQLDDIVPDAEPDTPVE